MVDWLKAACLRRQKRTRKLHAGDVVVIVAIDRLSRDTTGPLGIARDMQCARAGLYSPEEPALETMRDFAELMPVMLGLPTSWNAAASPGAPPAASRMSRLTGDIRPQAEPETTPAAGDAQADRRKRAARQRRPQLQRQPGDDFEAGVINGDGGAYRRGSANDN